MNLEYGVKEMNNDELNKAVPMQQVDINKIKADAVMGFVGTIAGAYSSNFVSTPIMNIAQLFQVARNSVKDEFGINTKTLAEEFSKEFAELCNQKPSPAVAVPENWRIVEKKTCYALMCGNEVIATMAGTEAQENAATIAKLLSSPALPNRIRGG